MIGIGAVRLAPAFLKHATQPAKPQQTLHFSSKAHQQEAPPNTKRNNADPLAAAFVLAFLTAAVTGIFFGPSIKERMFPNKDNSPPPATQKLEQGMQNPVERAQ